MSRRSRREQGRWLEAIQRRSDIPIRFILGEERRLAHAIDFGPKRKEESERGFIERMDVLMTQSVRDQMVDKYRFPETKFVTSEEVSKAWDWDRMRVRCFFGPARMDLSRSVWDCYKHGILKIPLDVVAKARQIIRRESGETLPVVKPGPSLRAVPRRPGRPSKAVVEIKTPAKSGRPMPLDEIEHGRIVDALAKSQGNLVTAAKLLRTRYRQLEYRIATWERENGIRLERASPGRPPAQRSKVIKND
jgi:Bacterial regulatory protein, Fis family